MDQQNSIPISEIREVEPNLNRELLSYFKGEKDGYVQVGSKKWFYPIKYKKFAETYINFEVRADDVWITGVPRSGTTVTQELVWLLSHDLDFEGAKEQPQIRVPFFEQDTVFNDKTSREYYEANPHLKPLATARQPLALLKNAKSRRVIKTHLPFELLPSDIFAKKCKVIYVCRYPKDVAVSYFSLQSQAWHIDYSGSFEKYWNFFQNGNCMFGPYFEHVKQGFEKRNQENFLFVFYEELRENLVEYTKKLSQFLERPVTKDELAKLLEYLDFDNFKNNPLFNWNDKNSGKKLEFIRKGEVGNWKNYFTKEMNEAADKWIQDNIERIGIRYPKRMN